MYMYATREDGPLVIRTCARNTYMYIVHTYICTHACTHLHYMCNWQLVDLTCLGLYWNSNVKPLSINLPEDWVVCVYVYVYVHRAQFIYMYIACIIIICYKGNNLINFYFLEVD